MVTRMNYERPNIDEKFYTVEQVAEKFTLQKNTVYIMCREGQLRHVKIGGVVRIPESALQTLLDGFMVGTDE